MRALVRVETGLWLIPCCRSACGSYAHAKCASYLQNGCHPGGHSSSGHSDDTLHFTPTGPPMFGGDLVAQAQKEGVEVPVVVSKCIGAVEAYGAFVVTGSLSPAVLTRRERAGMNYEGIYRKTGGMGQTKLITQHFERGQDFSLEDRNKFNDLAAITSCMKNYFRSLPNPLMTHDLHEDFVAAAGALLCRLLLGIPPVLTPFTVPQRCPRARSG